MRFRSFAVFKKKLLKDKAFRKEYEKLEPEFELACKLIEKRIQRGLSQEALAKKMNTKQSAIARLESGSYNMTLAFLDKAAKALDTRVAISLVDKPRARTAAPHSVR
ncbi:helix-turn-helix transcriptional regulator [Candidatus Uhrbacteria bacterium]|nr:helix-turn-helix transcriptional regulator [Candidatus Uhrbacteria bacterium]